MTKRTCTIDGCERKHRCKGYCGLHYDRHRKGADMDAPHHYERTLLDLFDERTEMVGDCLEWTGTISVYGYGVLTREGKQRFAHRLSYEMHNGPIPPEALICHRCDNRKCVLPEHLYAGTALTNQQDSIRAGTHHNQRKTHCKCGAEYDYISPTNGHRGCLACRKRQSDASHARQRAARDASMATS